MKASTNSPMSDLLVLCCVLVFGAVLCCGGSGLCNGGAVNEYVGRVYVEFGKLFSNVLNGGVVCMLVVCIKLRGCVCLRSLSDVCGDKLCWFL